MLLNVKCFVTRQDCFTLPSKGQGSASSDSESDFSLKGKLNPRFQRRASAQTQVLSAPRIDPKQEIDEVKRLLRRVTGSFKQGQIGIHVRTFSAWLPVSGSSGVGILWRFSSPALPRELIWPAGR